MSRVGAEQRSWNGEEVVVRRRVNLQELHEMPDWMDGCVAITARIIMRSQILKASVLAKIKLPLRALFKSGFHEEWEGTEHLP